MSLAAERIRHPGLLAKLMSPEEAAQLIPVGSNVGMSGFTGAGYPKAVPQALAQRLDALLRWLRAQGFSVTSWGDPVTTPLHLESYRGRFYFRADRIDARGALVRLDICYEQ